MSSLSSIAPKSHPPSGPNTIVASGSGQFPSQQQLRQPLNYNPAMPSSSTLVSYPRPEEMNFRPSGGRLPIGPPHHHMWFMGQPGPLLNRPVSISSTMPHNPAMEAGGHFSQPPNGTGNAVVNNAAAAMGNSGPFPPPPHFIPATNLRPFTNGGNGNPMMYLTQPGPVYSQGRTVLIPRIPVGLHHPQGMSRQYLGPPGLGPPNNQPPPPQPLLAPPPPPGGPGGPRVIAMTPQYNPYLPINPNFPMYPKATAPPPAGAPMMMHGGSADTAAADPANYVSGGRGERPGVVAGGKDGGHDLEWKSSASRVSPVLSPKNEPPPQVKVTTDNSAVSVAGSVGLSTSGSLAKVSAGRKNYKVAQSPSNGGGAWGVTSTSGTSAGRGQGTGVEVKAVSTTPILSTRVEEVIPLGECVCLCVHVCVSWWLSGLHLGFIVQIKPQW